MSGKQQGLTAAEVDGSLLAMALIEAGLRADHEALTVLFAEAERTPDGVLAGLVSSMCQLLHATMGDEAIQQVQHWRARILDEKPVNG
ncbi:hypothetical protein [Aeromicrobium sp.]|uniref:hypothetical protein n=1 Tax=Aeromicrobium sp. TaxID=1871063 RepID=UPI0030BF0807